MVAESSSESDAYLPAGHGLIRTVLLIDRPEVTSKLSGVIHACGWDAIEASNAGQARGLMERYKPEFIITEALLAGETGFEYCAFQKKLNCRIPIVFLSGIRLTAARNLAMWAGADAYLTKPIGGRALYETILAVALRVRERIESAERGLAGSIPFTCSCGRRLVMGAQHAGKA